MTPPDLLTLVGRALYGENWKRATSRLLNFGNHATVHQMLNGKQRLGFDHGIFEDLDAELATRIKEMTKAQSEIKRCQQKKIVTSPD